jgi:hypothetical protein
MKNQQNLIFVPGAGDEIGRAVLGKQIGVALEYHANCQGIPFEAIDSLDFHPAV